MVGDERHPKDAAMTLQDQAADERSSSRFRMSHKNKEKAIYAIHSSLNLTHAGITQYSLLAR